LGYPLAQDIRIYPEPTHKSVEHLIKQTPASFEDSAITSTIERLLSLRLAYFYLLVGNTTQVEKLPNCAGTNYQAGFEGLIRRGLGGRQEGQTECVLDPCRFTFAKHQLRISSAERPTLGI
jgi:hypothetical protein